MTHLKSPARLAAALAASLLLAGAAAAGPLTVTVDGVEARGGKLYIGVQTEAQFMQEDGVAGEIFEAPAAGSLSASFDLPEGRYAVSVWHDINADGVFDVDAQGVPLDGWSSLNAASLTAAPTFDQAAVSVPAGGVSVTLGMVYPQ